MSGANILAAMTNKETGMSAMNRIFAAGAILGGLVLAGTSAVSRAATITGVEVDDYSTAFTGRQASKTFNGTATESSFNGTDNWLTSNATTGSIAWSLSGKYTLNTVDVYNYRESAIPQNRGAQQVDVFYSSDWGKTFQLLGAPGTQVFAKAPVSGANTPTTLNFGGRAVTNVKFNVNSNYGDSGFVGLNEVEFFGTRQYQVAQAPITVSAFSSQYLPDGRFATHAADGVYEANTAPQMWMSDGSAGQQYPTITFSLGATPKVLDHLDVWNYNESTQAFRGLNTVKIQLFDASMNSLGFATDDADGDIYFALNENNSKFFGSATQDGNTLMDTLGISNAPAASFFKIITTTTAADGIDGNPNGAGFGGLTEVQAFEALPEPSSLGLLAVGGLAVLRRRRA
jgi:hypothetical protein